MPNDTRGGRFGEIYANKTQMPSLAEMFTRMRAKKEQEKAANPGAAPVDAQGGQQQVSLPGEAPIQAQPVSGPPQRVGVAVGQPQIQQRANVTMGEPQRMITTEPMRVQVPAQQPGQQITQQPGQQPGMQAQRPQQPGMDPQASMDPRAARFRALMSQGMTFNEAMRAMQQG